MTYQNTFNRYEIKYLITKEQKSEIEALMSVYMQPDKFGLCDIRNIYFDTPSKQLIRHSLEKPAYKEKLRIRSYGIVAPEDAVFVELKKKYQSIVYKRRIALQEEAAMQFIKGTRAIAVNSQIAAEIHYFSLLYQNLIPSMFISYQREAFCAKEDGNLRITFDENLRWRDYDLSLCSKNICGNELLLKSQVLMEIKTAFAIPLWLTAFLSEHRIFKSSFSKYGIAYETMLQMLQTKLQGGFLIA